jgi:aspartate kinase
MKPIVVKKFGGTSVGDLGRIRNVARLVRTFKEENPDKEVVVVVSAMAGETNRLVSLARDCVQHPDPRELDVLLATGELASSALTAMALQQEGLVARSFDGYLARINTDEHHTNAKIQSIDGELLRRLLATGGVPVVAGFQGVTPSGDFTTLGRGGSDITAVALAAALSAEACYIYTDVEGVYSADPRVCRRVRRLDTVCHEEMFELASLGAKVLHPRSVYFAMRYGVPLAVLSTFNPTRKTWIVKESELMEKPVVTGVTYRLDDIKVTVSGMPTGGDALSTLFTELADADVFIDVITQSEALGDRMNISFTVPEEASERVVGLLRTILPRLGASDYSIDRDIAKVSIVGVGMRYHAGVASKAFAVLGAEGIATRMISTSEIKLSVVIDRKYCEVAVRALHDAFVELDPETEIVVGAEK